MKSNLLDKEKQLVASIHPIMFKGTGVVSLKLQFHTLECMEILLSPNTPYKSQ